MKLGDRSPTPSIAGTPVTVLASAADENSHPMPSRCAPPLDREVPPGSPDVTSVAQMAGEYGLMFHIC